MPEKFMILVGDSFESFQGNEDVILVSDFENILRDPATRWDGDEIVVIGQGISPAKQEAIRSALGEAGVTYFPAENLPASGKITHKSFGENILISSPKKVSEYEYSMSLSIGEGFNGLTDHISGQHISGMIMMEAARQSVIAVAEIAYLTDKQEPWGFLLDKFNSTFSNYGFPLPAEMTVRIVEDPSSKRQSEISITLFITIIQAGKVVCEVELGTRLYARRLLEKMESRKAKQAIDAFRSQGHFLSALIPKAESSAIQAAN